MVDVEVDVTFEYVVRLRQPMTGEQLELRISSVHPDRLRFLLMAPASGRTLEEAVVPIAALWTVPRILKVVFDRGLRALEGD